MGQRIRGIWAELRRRRVVSSAAAYAAVAFVLLQLGEIVFPAFGFDESAMRMLVAGLLAGFPVVMALSWVFDVTRDGLKRTRPKHAEGLEDRPPAPGPSILIVALVLVCAAGLGWGGWYALRGSDVLGPAGPDAASIAVLPFTDMSEAGDQAYLGDGIAEEILNVLAGVPGLKVAARTSSFAFRDVDEDAREIGQRLGVGTLLEGSIRRDSLRVRVTAQLIDTQSGFHLWSGTFDQEMRDLFAVQDSIAVAIADALLGELDVPSSRPAVREVVPEAQIAYWQGRTEWNRRGPTGIPAAIRFFDQAIAIDSSYAEAHAGLADSYALLPQYVATADAAESWERAEEWASKAIRLDPDLAEAHASLGLVRAFQGDRAGALASLDRALQLNPSYAPALHWRANLLAEMGQLDPAREDIGRAADLDPLSAAIATDYGKILLWSGNPIGAETQFGRALALDFNFGAAHFGEALVALDEGDDVSFHMALAKWAAVSGLPVLMARGLADSMMAYRTSGTPAGLPEGLEALAAQRRMSSGVLASLYALVGARPEMLEWLRRAREDGSWVDQFLAVNTVYAPYRDDPAFRGILEGNAAP